MPAHLETRAIYLKHRLGVANKVIVSDWISISRRGKAKLQATLDLQKKLVVACPEFKPFLAVPDKRTRGVS